MKQQKTDRRSQRTQQLVSVAFTQLVLEKPYDAILVQNILDRAGIGRTTFYAHYFDKADVLNSMTEQMMDLFSQRIAHSTASQRVTPSLLRLPSLELFEHVYQSSNHHQQQMHALMRSHAGEPLWNALQTALCGAMESALAARCADERTPPIPQSVLAQYLANTLLTLLRWWITVDMPCPPEQIEWIFQRLALPGVSALLQDE